MEAILNDTVNHAVAYANRVALMGRKQFRQLLLLYSDN